MKTLFKNKAVLAFTLATAVGATFYACNKNSNMPAASATVTETDAIQMANDAVAPASGGMTAQITTTIVVYKGVKLSCGVQKDSTISYSSVQGASPSYSAQLSWNYTLSCNGTTPNSLAFSFTGSSSYDGPRMSLSGSSSGSFTLGGLAPTSANYTLNATYNRSGSSTSKIGNQHSYTSQTTIQGNNIVIDKSTNQIVSGSGSISIKGTDAKGNSFDFEGTITFNGGNKATVVFASGTNATITW